MARHAGNKDTHAHAHESPSVMLVPLGVLAVGAVFSGMVWYGSFFGDHAQVNRFFGMAEPHIEADGASHGEHSGHSKDRRYSKDNSSGDAKPTLAKRQWFLPLAQHHKGHYFRPQTIM